MYADVDRTKADMLGVEPSKVFEALQVYLGSAYVNDFNLLGRTYRVTAQADSRFRDDTSDIAQLKTRSATGEMVPIGSIATFRGPHRSLPCPRYNLFPAVEMDGEPAPLLDRPGGGPDGEDRPEPWAGFRTEWTDIAFQQKAAGNTAKIVFGLAVVFVFLVLAAQFESLTLPIAVILIVPMTLRGDARREPARHGQQHPDADRPDHADRAGREECHPDHPGRQAGGGTGSSILDAAVEAARIRLRPILMTSFAFILGTLPLVASTGAGAELRQALGTAVSSVCWA